MNDDCLPSLIIIVIGSLALRKKYIVGTIVERLIQDWENYVSE